MPHLELLAVFLSAAAFLVGTHFLVDALVGKTAFPGRELPLFDLPFEIILTLKKEGLESLSLSLEREQTT